MKSCIVGISVSAVVVVMVSVSVVIVGVVVSPVVSVFAGALSTFFLGGGEFLHLLGLLVLLGLLL